MPGGRPPKSTALHRLEGTFRPARHDRRRAEPVAPGALAELPPPAWLTEAQATLWRDIIARAPAGVLRAADAELFCAYVELADRHRRAVEVQNQLDAGRVTPLLTRAGPGSTVAESPYLRIADRCVMLMARLAAELGLSPLARVRLGAADGPLLGGEDADGDGWGSLGTWPTMPADHAKH